MCDSVIVIERESERIRNYHLEQIGGRKGRSSKLLLFDGSDKFFIERNSIRAESFNRLIPLLDFSFFLFRLTSF